MKSIKSIDDMQTEISSASNTYDCQVISTTWSLQLRPWSIYIDSSCVFMLVHSFAFMYGGNKELSFVA